ncbi:hypothetical protein AAKU61_002765 [Undibacterium sp. GrIS 1.2]|uniref:questin oxidase family protein n=1 Tax=Undibacterium sp. GrIS 1.2 TaxID=3143933 RepID=UPI003393FD93
MKKGSTESVRDYSASELLDQLLDASAHFALASKGTTNHCPMALIALAKMGASPERLQQFFSMWQNTYALPMRMSQCKVTADNWQRQLGQVDNFMPLRAYFMTAISARSTDEVLIEVLSQIPFAPATAAFHALIRLAYGLDAHHIGEIAAGLAHLVVSNLDIKIKDNQPQFAGTAEQALAQLSLLYKANPNLYVGDSIVGSLKAVVADPRFADGLYLIENQSQLLNEMMREMTSLAIVAYWKSKNFTVLHMVTAMHAARIVFARLPQNLVVVLLPQLWVAFCAAYVSVGAPSLPSLVSAEREAELILNSLYRTSPEQAWSDLFAKAIQSDNDHVIKLTHTCYEQNRIYPSPLYLATIIRLLSKTD